MSGERAFHRDQSEMLPARPAPAATVGALGWVRANLFSSYLNVALTLMSVGLLCAAVPPFLRETTRVSDIAREIDPDDVLEPDRPLDGVLEDAQRRHRGYYVVNAGGRVAGWVYVGDLLRAGRPRRAGRQGA